MGQCGVVFQLVTFSSVLYLFPRLLKKICVDRVTGTLIVLAIQLVTFVSLLCLLSRLVTLVPVLCFNVMTCQCAECTEFQCV